MKTKLLSFLFASLCITTNAFADDFIVADFENNNIGDSYDVHAWSPEDGSATVAVDPVNANNKTVNVIASNWDAMLKLNVTLPAGKTLADFTTFAFDIFIPTNAADEGANWKQISIYLDGEKVYADDGYPFICDLNTWTTKTYALSDLTLSTENLSKTSFTLAFGLSSNTADYHVYNVKFSSPGEVSEDGYFTIDDFEDKTIGDIYATKSWSPGDATATVTADPVDAENKVINMVTSNWDAAVIFDVILPEGTTLGSCESLSFDLYNTPSQEWAEFSKVQVYIDGDKIFQDDTEEPTSPFNTWTNKTYPMSVMTMTDAQKAKSVFAMAVGISIGTGNYYMDNIKLKTETTGDGGDTGIIDLNKVMNVYVDGDMLYLNGAASNIEIYDVKGYTWLSVKNAETINMSSLEKGIYIVKFTVEHKTFMKKIVR